MSQVIENLYYTEEHEWIKIEGDSATVGITDFAQSSLGDIVFVELPDEGTNLETNASFGVVESIKSVSDLYSPLDGEVTGRNTDVEDTPEKINEAPFESWLIKIKLSNTDQINSLMDSQAYIKFCQENS